EAGEGEEAEQVRPGRAADGPHVRGADAGPGQDVGPAVAVEVGRRHVDAAGEARVGQVAADFHAEGAAEDLDVAARPKVLTPRTSSTSRSPEPSPSPLTEKAPLMPPKSTAGAAPRPISTRPEAGPVGAWTTPEAGSSPCSRTTGPRPATEPAPGPVRRRVTASSPARPLKSAASVPAPPSSRTPPVMPAPALTVKTLSSPARAKTSNPPRKTLSPPRPSPWMTKA